MNYSRVLWMIFCLVLLFGCPKAEAQLTPVKVVYSSLSASESPLWVAPESRVFEKHGLAVTPVFIEGGTRSMAAMLGGDAPIGVVGGSAPILARLRGADTVILAGVFNTMPFSLVVVPSIKEARDLKGKKSAISTFGSSSDLAARMAIEHLGLKPVQDVAILQVGTCSTRVSAMESGSVHGTVVEFDNLPVIKKFGYRVLVNLSALGIEYQHVVVPSTTSFIRAHPAVMQSFMRGWADGIRFYKTRKEESKRAIARYSKIKDPEGLELLYQSYAKIFPDAPYPTMKGIASIVASLRQMDASLKEPAPESFVDLSWIKKLEAEGYFK